MNFLSKTKARLIVLIFSLLPCWVEGGSSDNFKAYILGSIEELSRSAAIVDMVLESYSDQEAIEIEHKLIKIMDWGLAKPTIFTDNKHFAHLYLISKDCMQILALTSVSMQNTQITQALLEIRKSLNQIFSLRTLSEEGEPLSKQIWLEALSLYNNRAAVQQILRVLSVTDWENPEELFWRKNRFKLRTFTLVEKDCEENETFSSPRLDNLSTQELAEFQSVLSELLSDL